MAITLSPATAAAFKSLATASNSETPFGTGILAVFAPVANVQGLAADIAAFAPNSSKPYAIARISDNGAEAFLADTAEEAADVVTEMSYHAVEATFC